MSTSWLRRVRQRIRQREALRVIIVSYRQHRYRMRHFARIMMQSRVRGWLKWKRYRKLKWATPIVQNWWRMMLAIWEKCRLQRTRVRWALLIVQRNIRWFVAKQIYTEWLVATTRIQRWYRKVLDRVRVRRTLHCSEFTCLYDLADLCHTFLTPLQAFMWERYHFFAAQELEHWVGCNVGCVIVPKKYVRHYEPRYA